MNSSSALRSAFLDFFREREHTIVASGSLVPGNDPSLLFTNAGMVPFKDVFLGREQRPYVRATSSQRCVRAGGKHNDLENVGYTARHHTFFEMLGNFSFGVYFKREAIEFAWEFLTGCLQLPSDRLWVTVFEEDDEAARLWLHDIGIDPARFARIGAKDNFWSMGDTGPCGPCSEIFYDHGPRYAGGPPGSPDADGDRYVEIWNLVFMQYDRAADGCLTPLPRPSVDTGMGLERLAAVMQGVHSNYDIDTLRRLVTAAAQLAGIENQAHSSLRVIADHIRSTAFLIMDGVVPANEGRGYVLRRIMRRALRHGHNLGLQEPFFYKLLPPLVQEMGDAYPHLRESSKEIATVVRQEEERFAETLTQGLKILERDLAELSGTVVPGTTVFKLYDTYGFPVDLTADIARERGLSLDLPGFEQAMQQQRERARAASAFKGDYRPGAKTGISSEFTGYDYLAHDAIVVALTRAGEDVEQLDSGERGAVVLDRTPFYAESGGQVGDRGVLAGAEVEFEVEDTQKEANAHVHYGIVKRGTLRLGAAVDAGVDAAARHATALNHSATHLLHAALKQVLGEHVRQKGSLVEPARLRFDFAHFAPVTREQNSAIERLVNEQILKNTEARTDVMDYDQAVASGAVALFGEKYGAEVRVLRLGDFSTELCGGTHVRRVGDIGLFKILSESGVAAGVRRIEAVTGYQALDRISEDEQRITRIADMVKGSRDSVEEKVSQLADRNRRLEKELSELKARLAGSQGSDLAAQAEDVEGIKVVAARLDGADIKTLRDTVDKVKNRLGSAVVVLAAAADGKVSLVAGVTADHTDKLKAGDLANAVAAQIGGKGGGRADMAQAGGSNPGALDGALKSVPAWVRSQLA